MRLFCMAIYLAKFYTDKDRLLVAKRSRLDGKKSDGTVRFEWKLQGLRHGHGMRATGHCDLGRGGSIFQPLSS